METEMKRWAAGKEGNLRALLSSLQQVYSPSSYSPLVEHLVIILFLVQSECLRISQWFMKFDSCWSLHWTSRFKSLTIVGQFPIMSLRITSHTARKNNCFLNLKSLYWHN